MKTTRTSCSTAPADDPAPKVTRLNSSDGQAAPVLTAGRQSLHALPEELLVLVLHHLLPASPCLPRPPGQGPSHYPIGPGLRALTNWRISCKWIEGFLDQHCKHDSLRNFGELAVAVATDFGKPGLPQALSALFDCGLAARTSGRQVEFLDVFEPSSMESRATSLEERAPSLQTLVLRLRYINYPDAAVQRLVTALASCHDLRVLKLQSNAPFPIALLDALKSLTKLRTLQLLGDKFPLDLFAQLASLPGAAKLESLALNCPVIGGEIMGCLAEQGAAFGALRFLHLEAGGFQEGVEASLVAASASLPRVASLHLHAGAEMMMEPIGRRSRRFAARPERLDMKMANVLVTALAQGGKVCCLGLHGLAQQPEARSNLFQTLGSYQNLRALSLGGPLDAECVRRIGLMLADPDRCLQKLDVEGAIAGDEQWSLLAEGIRGSVHLRELRLAKVGFTKQSALTLAAALEENQSLVHWTVDCCTIGTTSQGPALSKVLSKNPRLREFHFKMDEPSDPDARGVFAIPYEFLKAAMQSNSLLHVTFTPTWGSNWDIQQKLLANRRLLEAGL